MGRGVMAEYCAHSIISLSGMVGGYQGCGVDRLDVPNPEGQLVVGGRAQPEEFFRWARS